MRLIAIVGADGTGKSTQARALAARLTDMGYRARCVRPVFLLFDPWKLRRNPEGSGTLSPRTYRVRAGIDNGGETRGWSPPRMARAAAGYLYALAAYGYLRTALRGVQFVVCDRYFYQFFFDLCGPDAKGLAGCFPRPDMVVWLDGDLELLRDRMDRPPVHPEEIHYSESALAFYRSVGSDLGFVRIDAGMDRAAVGERIWQALMRQVGQWRG